ncbi:PilZ domain-containing protein [Thalassolituus pacificus]|uniref:PilZ domain-containing protein n=1 Tax=Thalassolituus pacificus TaxID=2975440 RepID=A0A9X2WE89_9GAMM|nr:PilZ domain-containing protein [Thalassolituus pacificus]MCT7358092.1 PilZ domain-containing protein [Thalassolituus pacificus]
MSTNSDHEQRMHPRWILKSNVSVFERQSKEYLGLLVDCSEQGVMISTYDQLQPGTTLQIDLVDIAPHANSRRTGQCRAEVVWCDKITPSLYGSGCRISQQDDTFDVMLKGYSHAHE